MFDVMLLIYMNKRRIQEINHFFLPYRKHVELLRTLIITRQKKLLKHLKVNKLYSSYEN